MDSNINGSIKGLKMDRVLMVGAEWEECAAIEHVTPHMAALRALPFYDCYGKKRVPTSYMVHYLGRTRRVYCDSLGNSGVCYVEVKGVKHYVH